MAEQEDTGMAILSHILALFLGFIGPLIIYLTSDEETFARENARNSLNWQISVTLMGIIAFVLMLVGGIFSVFLIGLIPLMIGVLMAIILAILDLVFIIIGSIRASDGEAWEYPLTYDFV